MADQAGIDSDELVRRAVRGDQAAMGQLLARHRDRLRKMVAVHLDPRLVARVDPSDVVQETLMDASRKLSEYLHQHALPFYPWLRQLAWKRLSRLHEQHVHARKRSVLQEQFAEAVLSDQSAMELAVRIVAGSGTSPSGRLIREEQRHRVRAALARLPARDRQVLVLRHLEGLSVSEMAAVLGVAEGTVKSRHFRALERLHNLLSGESGEELR